MKFKEWLRLREVNGLPLTPARLHLGDAPTQAPPQAPAQPPQQPQVQPQAPAMPAVKLPLTKNWKERIVNAVQHDLNTIQQQKTNDRHGQILDDIMAKAWTWFEELNALPDSNDINTFSHQLGQVLLRLPNRHYFPLMSKLVGLGGGSQETQIKIPGDIAKAKEEMDALLREPMSGSRRQKIMNILNNIKSWHIGKSADIIKAKVSGQQAWSGT